jgi:hypothetical protein
VKSPQVAEGKPNIFFEIVSHLPLGFAILNLDRENHHEGALTTARLLLFGSFLEERGSTSVKKSTKQARTQKPRPVVAELVVLQPLGMEGLRGHISNLVCANAVEMVQTTVERVKKGQHQAMKYLFEMIGLFPATAVPDVPQEDSLAGMLLSRLGVEEETLAEVKHANHVK